MAANAGTIWRVRADGDTDNGGGWDETISGAGTDYTDRATPILAPTDMECTGDTTVTSDTGGFTSAMVGNCLRIDASQCSPSTNWQDGYYFITGYVDTNEITVDTTPTNGSSATGGVGSIGGAFIDLRNLSDGVSGLSANPFSTSPLVPGNTVFIQGGGTEDPSVADYDWSAGYWTFPDGNASTGRIRWEGYNGRPLIEHRGIIIYQCDRSDCVHISFKQTVSGFTTLSPYRPSSEENGRVIDCIFDQNGIDGTQCTTQVYNSEFRNTGSTTAGTTPVITVPLVGGVFGCWIHDCRGHAIEQESNGQWAINNIITDNGGDGIRIVDGSGAQYGSKIIGNTIDDNGGSGIYIDDIESMLTPGFFINNNITNNDIGIELASGTQALADHALEEFFRYNNVYNNTTSNYSGLTAQTSVNGNLSTDPGYANAGSNDYTPSNV